ncbi:MAG: FAD:protein FMN transferase [Candidimonas sp.]|nr:MAG: FAD:protein FMN transferase [Candidimonas sp.]
MPKISSDSGAAGARVTLYGPVMGTRWSVTLDGAPATGAEPLRQDLAASVRQVDQQMSPWKADSDLTRLNLAPAGVWVALPPEMFTVLARALEVARLSAGAFDPTVGELVDAWGFGATRERPDPAAIQSARASVKIAGHARLELDLASGRARKQAPMRLDLCGIAKGYAVDRMAAVLRHHGVRYALACLDGELRAIGGQADGRAWAVALESPEPGRRAARGVIELRDLAVATSGDYRRYWQVGETRLAHTIDPRRTVPLNNGVASVTVLARDCMDADGWATALLVAGPDEGPALARRLGLEALFLLRHGGCIVERGVGRFAVDAGNSQPK